MTLDMAMGLVRQVFPFLGAVAVTMGLLKPEVATSLVDQALVVGGGIITLIGTAWAIKANTKASILQSAEQMPEVHKIEVSDPKLILETKTPKVTAVRHRA